MQYPRRIQVKTKTTAQSLPPTELYRWAVSSTFVALSQHGSTGTASMLAGCLVGWSFGCLAGSLFRCLGCSRLVCVCVRATEPKSARTEGTGARMALVKGYRFTWGGGIFRPKPPVFVFFLWRGRYCTRLGPYNCVSSENLRSKQKWTRMARKNGKSVQTKNKTHSSAK